MTVIIHWDTVCEKKINNLNLTICKFTQWKALFMVQTQSGSLICFT